MKILTTIMILMLTLTVIMMMTMKISKKSKSSREKNSPFECGFSPMNSARKPFSIHFFLIATMFLIFDIEISILMPMTFKTFTESKQWMISSNLTLMILIIGLYHEWKNGMLEWSK
nr:NADH dehydrogenase subunit 3 [Tropiduchidae sp. 2 WQW-2023a]